MQAIRWILIAVCVLKPPNVLFLPSVAGWVGPASVHRRHFGLLGHSAQAVHALGRQQAGVCSEKPKPLCASRRRRRRRERERKRQIQILDERKKYPST